MTLSWAIICNLFEPTARLGIKFNPETTRRTGRKCNSFFFYCCIVERQQTEIKTHVHRTQANKNTQQPETHANTYTECDSFGVFSFRWSKWTQQAKTNNYAPEKQQQWGEDTNQTRIKHKCRLPSFQSFPSWFSLSFSDFPAALNKCWQWTWNYDKLTCTSEQVYIFKDISVRLYM